MIINARSEGRDAQVSPPKWTISTTRGIRTIGGTQTSAQCAQHATRQKRNAKPQKHEQLEKPADYTRQSDTPDSFDPKTQSIGKNEEKQKIERGSLIDPGGDPSDQAKDFADGNGAKCLQ